jgi:hypothetical protein
MQSIWINDPWREGKVGGATAGNAGENRLDGGPREKLFGVSYFSNPVGEFRSTYHSEVMDEDPALFSMGERRKFQVYRWPLRLLRFIYKAEPYYYTAPLTHPLNLTGSLTSQDSIRLVRKKQP